jgi:2-polyprenyl-3-methyl-5-hydroxy-6-metoxy-1,4-benzoquinol methylase
MANQICPWWLAYAFDNRLRRLVHDPERMLAPYVSPGMTVLDAGCGMGFFSLALARLVGDDGIVIAADVQPEMLAAVARRAAAAGLSGRIRTHRCEPDDLGVEPGMDFILAVWMVHEVPDSGAFFGQARSCLEPGGKMLVAEPKLHVSRQRFEAIVASARSSGLAIAGSPAVGLSRAVVLERDPSHAAEASRAIVNERLATRAHGEALRSGDRQE